MSKTRSQYLGIALFMCYRIVCSLVTELHAVPSHFDSVNNETRNSRIVGAKKTNPTKLNRSTEVLTTLCMIC